MRMQFWRLVTLACAGLMAAASAAPERPARTLSFAGYDWTIRGAGKGGPGPNLWDPANVLVDADGRLHLKLTHAADGWHCAELSTTKRLGFGRYQFQVVGRIDQLDPNVVLGLFDYPTPDVGKDGSNEIDIEFARWGRATSPIGNFTVFPASGKKQTTHPFEVALNGDYTTHRFTRSAEQVTFQSLNGHQDGDVNEFASWAFRPEHPKLEVPQHPEPVNLNLWLFRGKPPTDGKEVEIILSGFIYTPA